MSRSSVGHVRSTCTFSFLHTLLHVAFVRFFMGMTTVVSCCNHKFHKSCIKAKEKSKTQAEEESDKA